MNNIRQRISLLVEAMGRGAYEREEVIALSLLTAISGESIFLLGLPGVGKSMVARRLKMAFRHAASFEYLMSRFSTPDEIFGPVSISRLKDEDTYERITEGYLPSADVVFLDEIWKAGPAIQNSLLTALNERIFRNGNHDIHLPLKTIIAASNELPAEGEGLEALWDRFLVRYIVQPISNREAFMNLLTQKGDECVIDDELRFSETEYKEIRRAACDIVLPDMVCSILCDIREILCDESKTQEDMPGAESVPYVSDRRWRKIVGLLRTSALLNGRQKVDASDCMLLEHLLWDTDEQIPSVRRIVAKVIAKRMVRRLPADLAMEVNDSGTMALTKPVGGLLSPDGRNYVFSAAGEDVFIDRTDYESLGQQTVFGNITMDNHLVVSQDRGAFTVSRTGGDTITLNSFTYRLKHTSPLRTGSTTDLLKRINQGTEYSFTTMKYLIRDNLFLRHISSYVELEEAFNELKIKQSSYRK